MKHLAKLMLIVLLLPGFSWATGLDSDQQQWIQDHLDSGDLVGLAVVSIKGDSIEHYAYGQMSVNDPRPPGVSSQFEIGSITKVFTNLLLAEMVALGKLSYDTSLSELLPQLEFVNPAVGQITLLELGTHTSGLPRLPPNLPMTDPADPYADYDAEALLEALQSARPDQELSKVVSYSNFGVGLLGYLLGQADGSSYAEALETYVLKPLGMNTATVSDNKSLLPGHHAGEVVSNWHFDALAGAGVLRSSAIELSRVFAPWLSPKPGLLVHDTAADLEIVATAGNQLSVTRVWMKVGEGKQQIYWHNGGTGGFRSFAGFNPATGEGWIVLSNSDFEVTEFGLGLFANPPESARETPAMATRDFSEYFGYFAITPAFVLSVFEQQGQLLVQATGQPPLRIAASGKDQFTLLAVDARLVFERDDSGAVIRAILYQNDQVMPAERVAGPASLPEFVEIEVDTTALKALAGSYELAPGALFKVRVDGRQLMIKLASQPWLPVFPFAVDQFFYKVVNAQITFNREDGQVVSLTLHQNGANQVAPKR